MHLLKLTQQCPSCTENSAVVPVLAVNVIAGCTVAPALC